jgi:DNA (cytosine-5)-methyltransferase 1
VRPRLLDLFCGAGGAAVGYHRAGFEVVGVDIKQQPNYPYEFIRADALLFLAEAVEEEGWPGESGYDAIHASPPCQRYIRSGNVDRERHLDLLPIVRRRLEQIGLPWVIENVPGAPMRADALLCGSQFGLEVRRHRLFEVSWGEPVLVWPCDHTRPITGVYGHAHGSGGAADGMLPGDLATWSRAMGIDWMTTGELADAIPPAYTEFVGAQLLQHLLTVAA